MTLTVYSTANPIRMKKDIGVLVDRAVISARKIIDLKTPYLARLTMIEVAVMQMLADGVALNEIKSEAKISPAESRRILSSIRRKTETRTTYEAIAWAVRNKVIL